MTRARIKYLRDGYIQLSTHENKNYVVTKQQLKEIKRMKEHIRMNKGKNRLKI